MIRPIAIVLGEPNSVFSEIIFKVILTNKSNFFPFILIGNYDLIKKQLKYFNKKIKIEKITNNFNLKKINKNKLFIINVPFKQVKPFEKISSKSNKFIFKCFDISINLLKYKKVSGLINGPIAKEFLFKKKFKGVTEYLSHKMKLKNKEVMLIYNKNLSVSPITTHLPIKNISKSLKKKDIINKVNTIALFYKKFFKKKIKIGITGLNPHSYSPYINSEEEKIIKPAIQYLKKKKLNIIGPISADTVFTKNNIKNFDVIIGMYHDQVLAPIKTLYGFESINLTIGLPFIRVTPDHGVGADIVAKYKASPKSLIKCFEFFKNLK